MIWDLLAMALLMIFGRTSPISLALLINISRLDNLTISTEFPSSYWRDSAPFLILDLIVLIYF